jgi:hypothetical protein
MSSRPARAAVLASTKSTSRAAIAAIRPSRVTARRPSDTLSCRETRTGRQTVPTIAEHWRHATNERESLAVCLRAVLAAGGATHAYDELVAVLGLGALAVAAPDQPIETWPTIARDCCLVSAAKRLGLRLRELHPPEAARGLEASREFPDHFRDSYYPLILAAIEHQQPVLAWCGWPPPAEREWGLVVGAGDDALLGLSIGSADRVQPMAGAARQVYVVESAGPPGALPDPSALFRHVASQAVDLWYERAPLSRTHAVGAAAYRAFRRVVDHASDSRDSNAAGGIAALCRSLSAARRSLAIWLRRIDEALDAYGVRAGAYWSAQCDRVVTALAAYHDESAVADALARPAGAAALLYAVDEATAADGEAMENLQRIADGR